MITRCTRVVRVVLSRARIRSSNSARMNNSNFNTENIVQCTHGSVLKLLFIAMLTIGYNY